MSDGPIIFPYLLASKFSHFEFICFCIPIQMVHPLPSDIFSSLIKHFVSWWNWILCKLNHYGGIKCHRQQSHYDSIILLIWSNICFYSEQNVQCKQYLRHFWEASFWARAFVLIEELPEVSCKFCSLCKWLHSCLIITLFVFDWYLNYVGR